MMDITGIIKKISDAQQVSEKFKKRDFVIADNSSQYPQHILFQLTQDKCGLMDRYRVGDEIKVHFNIRGREWTSPKNEVHYFNSLEAWRIEGCSVTENDSSNHRNGNSDYRDEKDYKSPDFQDKKPYEKDDLPF